MFVLAIDTATPAITAAVLVAEGIDVTVLAGRSVVDPRRHGELLTPLVGEALDEAGRGPEAIGAVVAGTGPGPYTGLRVGLVTAAAFADALGVPAYGVGSLDAIAGAADPVDGALLVATDARRSEVYWAAYRDAARVSGPDVGKPAALAELIGELGAVAAAGAGAEQYAEVLGLPLLEPPYPDPRVLVRAAEERIEQGAPTEPLTPAYLRRPDATPPVVSTAR